MHEAFSALERETCLESEVWAHYLGFPGFGTFPRMVGFMAFPANLSAKGRLLVRLAPLVFPIYDEIASFRVKFGAYKVHVHANCRLELGSPT